MKTEKNRIKAGIDDGTIINALSVDLEDWYHVCGVQKYSAPSQWPVFESRIRKNTEKVLTLLSDFKVKATFFILGYIAEKSPSLVKEIAAQGHETASHSYYHKRIFEMEPKEFEDDLKRSLDSISSLTGKKVHGFRAPEWSIRPSTLWALDILKAHNIQYDSSMVPLSAMGSNTFPRYPCMIKTQDTEIMEFPLTTTALVGQNIPFTGGFSLRIMPTFFVQSKIKGINKKGIPALVYFHPWEFDIYQPSMDLPFDKKLIHYYNLKGTYQKVRGLLEQFYFAPVKDVLQGFFTKHHNHNIL